MNIKLMVAVLSIALAPINNYAIANQFIWSGKVTSDFPELDYEEHPSDPVTKQLMQTSEPLVGEFVNVPAGTYYMGNIFGGGENDEYPVHRVTVYGFRIGKYEVTQAQWRRVMGSDPAYFSGCDNCPVESISWKDVKQFITELNKKTIKQYRLPTEAEWEYACRSGGMEEKYCGGNNPDTIAWFAGKTANKPKPVGQSKPNAIGLFDMSGNVFEWVEDCWNYNYKNAPNTGKVWSEGDCSRAVLRGGAWNYSKSGIRSTGRTKFTRNGKFDNVGFRLASDD